MTLDEIKGWLPQGVEESSLPDSAFAWISDTYRDGKTDAKTGNRKLPYQLDGKTNEAGWKAAWSRAHQMDESDFTGGPSKSDVLSHLLSEKPDGVDAGKSADPPEVKVDQVDDDDVAFKSGQFEVKTLDFTPASADSTDLKDGEFSGYVAAFNSLDAAGDVILPGAFKDTIPDFLQTGAICWQHDWSEPIGKPLEAKEDPNGLFLKAHISDTSRGRDALTLLRDGVVKRLSIGYEVKGAHWMTPEEGEKHFGSEAAYKSAVDSLPRQMTRIRALDAIHLFEGSPVTVPANGNALITGVKSALEEELTSPMTLVHNFEVVHGAISTLTERYTRLAAIRAKDGRQMSDANVTRLSDMRDCLAEHVDALEQLLGLDDGQDGDETGDAAVPVDPMMLSADEAEHKAADARRTAAHAAHLYAQFQEMRAQFGVS